MVYSPLICRHTIWRPWILFRIKCGKPALPIFSSASYDQLPFTASIGRGTTKLLNCFKLCISRYMQQLLNGFNHIFQYQAFLSLKLEFLLDGGQCFSQNVCLLAVHYQRAQRFIFRLWVAKDTLRHQKVSIIFFPLQNPDINQTLQRYFLEHFTPPMIYPLRHSARRFGRDCKCRFRQSRYTSPYPCPVSGWLGRYNRYRPRRFSHRQQGRA